MPRSAAVAIENNFRNGLVTEATGLTFPENACTETYDCVFDPIGSVYRRTRFDVESGYATRVVNRTNKAVSHYVWRNVAGDGDTTLLVVQIGETLYFYTTTNAAVSAGALVSTIPLTPVSTVTSATLAAIECQYSDGRGYLLVTHPHMDPIRVAYTASGQTLAKTALTLKIRDLQGDEDDPSDIDERPAGKNNVMNSHHRYNLHNQGWTATQLNTWDAVSGSAVMPSNCDVNWTFRSASGAFAFDQRDTKVRGNSPAPKGHFILSLANQARSSEIAGATNTTTGIYRPTTCAFWVGRAWYAGIQTGEFTSRIYFTQILERLEQWAQCYQQNDPTSETLFDLLPSDGGVIDIPDAGTIYKLTPVPGGMLVNASNGVWFITGSQALGFTANDYTVQKISDVATLSAKSVISVAGAPCWWNSEGVWIARGENNGAPGVQLLSGKIKTFYDAIPNGAKFYITGVYHPLEQKVQWLYRTTAPSTVAERYEFDRILVLDLQTGAFYPWTISSSTAKIHSVFVLPFSADAPTITPVFKYLMSYSSSGSYRFTFADTNAAEYRDWQDFDGTGTAYTSYFISGYKLRGEGIRKWQPAWLQVWSDTTLDTQYYFQNVWDYATTGNTGRWSSKQYVSHTNNDYGYAKRRLRPRGFGFALQFKVTSVADYPFFIIGWSSMDMGNSLP